MIRFEAVPNGDKYSLVFHHMTGPVEVKGVGSPERHYTKALLFRDEGLKNDNPIEKSGMAICNSGDNFSRPIGRQLALHDLTKEFHHAFRRLVWKAYAKACKDNPQVFHTVRGLLESRLEKTRKPNVFYRVNA